MKHLLSSKELSRVEIEALLDLAQSFLPTVRNKEALEIAKGKILATLFFEPSTRTRFSFETAMLRLGGSVISNGTMKETSSDKKGETLFDTGKVVSAYANIIAMRHPISGSVPALAEGSDVPVMNGGDGPADHPTQGLLDLLTIQLHLGRLDGFTFMGLGDMKYSRVVHSDVTLLSNFGPSKFIFVTPPELAMPQEYVDLLESKGHTVEQHSDMEAGLKEADVVTQTRVQAERFPSEAEYLKHKGIYVIGKEQMEQMKEDSILMHPLPRIDEILPEVDSDPRAKYFEQVSNGVAIRMAIIAYLLDL
ncbi:MAG: aspartate carbamoyltransferase catalytic subunit [Oceanicoccus sp.]|jgi:aspartate carbamoyltransferase catalytic subunit